MVSILTTVYNASDYLVRCMGSVRNQTYTDYEFILLDDGSTDESMDIITAYSVGDARIRIYSKEHRDVSCCRKELINLAKGDAVVFLDADDYIEPDFLLKMVTQKRTCNAEAVMCGYVREYGDKTVRGIINIPTGFFNEKDWERIKRFKLLYDEETGNADNASTVWNLLADRELYIASAKMLEDDLSQGEDAILAYGVLLRAKNVCILDDLMYHYSQREGSLMRQGFFLSADNRELFEKSLKKAVTAAGYEELCISVEKIREKLDLIAASQTRRSVDKNEMYRYIKSLRQILSYGQEYKLVPKGLSMLPLIDSKTDSVWIAKGNRYKVGDILLYERSGELILHRLVKIGNRKGRRYFITKGDNCVEPDKPIKEKAVLGKVIRIEHNNQCKDIRNYEGVLYRYSNTKMYRLRDMYRRTRKKLYLQRGYRLCNCCGHFAPFKTYEDQDWDLSNREKYYIYKDKMTCPYCGSVPYMRLSAIVGTKTKGYMEHDILSYSLHPPIEIWLQKECVKYYVIGPRADCEPIGVGFCDEDPELYPDKNRKFKSLLCVHGLEFAKNPLEALDELIEYADEEAVLILAYTNTDDEKEISDRNFKSYVFGSGMDEKIRERLSKAGFVSKDFDCGMAIKEYELTHGPANYDKCMVTRWVRPLKEEKV